MWWLGIVVLWIYALAVIVPAHEDLQHSTGWTWKLFRALALAYSVPVVAAALLWAIFCWVPNWVWGMLLLCFLGWGALLPDEKEAE